MVFTLKCIKFTFQFCVCIIMLYIVIFFLRKYYLYRMSVVYTWIYINFDQNYYKYGRFSFSYCKSLMPYHTSYFHSTKTSPFSSLGYKTIILLLLCYCWLILDMILFLTSSQPSSVQIISTLEGLVKQEFIIL